MNVYVFFAVLFRYGQFSLGLYMLWTQKIPFRHLSRYCTALILRYILKDISIAALCSAGSSLTRLYEAPQPLKW